MTTDAKLQTKLDGLYDRLSDLGDLRDRGYAVPLSDITDVKSQIRLLESLRDSE